MNKTHIKDYSFVRRQVVTQNARFCLPLSPFEFKDEPPVEPKPPTAPAATPPKTPPAPSEPKTPEPIDVRLAKIKASDPKLFNTIFGRGVTKGTADAKSPLDEEKTQAALKLFEKVSVEDIDKLLKAQQDATEAALEKAKVEKNFNDYAEQTTTKHQSEISNQSAAYETQLKAVKESLEDSTIRIAKLSGALKDIKIAKELISGAKAKGFIDPSDAVANLVGQLRLNDALDIVEINSVDNVPVKLDVLIDNLIASKPHLVSSRQRKGQGTPQQPAIPASPNDSTEKPVFKRSQLADPAFFNKHKKEIMLANSEGRIIDDISKPIV